MEYNGYKIVSDDGMGYRKIKPLGKGSVSAALGGLYTTVQFAQKAIDAHLSTKKGTQNGKADNSK